MECIIKRTVSFAACVSAVQLTDIYLCSIKQWRVVPLLYCHCLYCDHLCVSECCFFLQTAVVWHNRYKLCQSLF